MKFPPILYLHGRPAPHPLHGRFADSVEADFQYVDFKVRWQDKPTNPIKMILSWIVCAFSYPKKKYTYFLVDNLHMAPVLMKKLGLLRKNQKIIAHLGSHTLYFLYSNWFSKWSSTIHLYMLKNYDYLICEGLMAEELAYKILPKKCPRTFYTFLGPPRERAKSLSLINPKLNSNKILLISNGPSGFREHYKGLDIMVSAFNLALRQLPNLFFTIVGDWDQNVINKCYPLMDSDHRDKIIFTGKVKSIESYLSDSSLYLHCSRGDAFPTSSIEAMTAGLVPIVSEWTGTKQLVQDISEKLIVPLEVEEIANRIIWYFNLPLDQKFTLSEKAKKVSSDFTEEKAVEHYRETFLKIICQDIN